MILTDLEDLPGRAEGQNRKSHHEISNGKWNYEEVCDGAKFGTHEDGSDDQAIADDHHHVDEKKNDQRGDQKWVVPGNIVQQLCTRACIHNHSSVTRRALAESYVMNTRVREFIVSTNW